jgi:hypothetical protein
MEYPQAMTRRERRAGAGRRRHRGRFRHRSYPLIVVVGTLAVAVSTYAYQAALLAALQTPRPQDALRHALTVALLVVAVLSQGGALRAADRALAAAVVPALVVLVPILLQGIAAVRGHLAGSPPDLVTGWLMLAYPSVGALAALIAADGIRSVLGPPSVVPAVACVGALAAASHYWPTSFDPGSAWEAAALQAVVAGMTVSSALVASSRLPASARWWRAMGCAVPAVLLAVAPTLLTAPAELVPAQRWTVVVYPLGCLAASSVAVLLVGSSELANKFRIRYVIT